MIPDDIWHEQQDFNRGIRPTSPSTEDEITNYLRDMSLNVISEVDELLRTTAWRKHRRKQSRPNHDHRLEELIDIFKLWLSMVQDLGFTDLEIEQMFWRKSMVVRQRHSEEWVLKLDRPTVVVDIDNVLCDYTRGFCTWIINRAPLFARAAQKMLDEYKYFERAGDFGMTESEWQGMKHEFRTYGHKRFLPVIPGSVEFLRNIRDAGYYIILLTSRPVDQYPNIYTDTLWWLHDNNLVYDWVWWSLDKGERLISEKALKHIVFAVDDDPKYVAQFSKVGLKTYWLQTTNYKGVGDRSAFYSQFEFDSNVQIVRSLSQIPIPPLHQITGVPHA